MENFLTNPENIYANFLAISMLGMIIGLLIGLSLSNNPAKTKHPVVIHRFDCHTCGYAGEVIDIKGKTMVSPCLCSASKKA